MVTKHFDDIKIEFKESTETYAKLVAEPFDRGYAVTVGNGLRRVLMTSVPGAAITSIKIDGVQHEFSNVDGVLEDISDIILNLKEVMFKVINDGPELISVKLQGPTEFTAKDIQNVTNDFEVLNKDHCIATINKKIKIDIDIRISRGKGYSPAQKNKRNDDALGTIQIDALFNPITRVSWNVESIPTSTEEQERLILEIDSNGATSPKDALNHSANILRHHMQYFMFDDSPQIKAVNDEEINEAIELRSILSKSIDEMELSVRSHNCLQAAGIYYIADLVSKEESEMLKYKNFGRKSLTELGEKLDELSLKFGMDISSYIEE